MKLVAVDTETTGLNHWLQFETQGYHPARPFAFSFCWEDGTTEFYRWKVNHFTREVTVDKKSFKKMQKILGDPKITKIFHNAPFDRYMLEKVGFIIRGKIHDTWLVAHTVTGGSEMQYGLKYLAKKFLDYPDDDQKDLQASVVKGRRQGKINDWCIATPAMKLLGRKPVFADYWLADPKLLKKYAIGDVERTMLLFLMWKPEITKNRGMKKTYKRELDVMEVLRRMEKRGVRVSPQDLERLDIEFQSYLEEQEHIWGELGYAHVNWRSTKQVAELIYEELGYPAAYTEKGNYRLDKAIALGIANGGRNKFGIITTNEEPNIFKAREIIRTMLEMKAAWQELNTFVRNYKNYMVKEGPNEYILHGSYRQVGAKTGRISCSDPNLMQVADTKGRRSSEIQHKPREAFACRDGHLWYLPDYSQIEVRLFAYLSKDPKMIDLLHSGSDFHAQAATRAWGHEPDFKKEFLHYRKRAKILMFCLLYGGGYSKIMDALRATYAQAVDFKDQWDEQIPGMQKQINRLKTRASRDGHIVNLYGRHHYYDDPRFSYRAVNHEIQGTAADIMKSAMIRIEKNLVQKDWPKMYPLMTLHDEYIIEVPYEYHSLELMHAIRAEMQWDSIHLLKFPRKLPIDFEIATHRWAFTKKIDIDKVT